MPKISISILGWAGTEDETLFRCIGHALDQTYADYEVVYTDNSSKRLVARVRERFGNNPKLRIVEYAENFGYAKANNLFFADTDSELLMVLNPDAMLSRDYIRFIVEAFNDPLVAAAAGKMLRPEGILDGTGIVMDITRRGRERGQLEEDRGHYDSEQNVFGVSGSAAAYRKSALEAVAVNGEYFDTDFYMYWEDVDLSWRLRLAGFSCCYVPQAIVYHARTAGQSRGGYKKIFSFIKHHSALPVNIRRWNWRNHLFMIIKNDFGWALARGLPFILLRELAMLLYICIVEPRTLGAVPDFFRLLPTMLRKRKHIQAHRKITSAEIGAWFSKIIL